MKIKAIMLYWSQNVQQHPPRVLIWVCRGVWKQKPPEGGGRMLSTCTELCSRSLNWSWSAPSCAWPFFLTPWENQAPKGQMQQGFHGWWKLWLPSSPLHLNPLTWLNPGCGGVSALCNNKPVTGQVLQGQWDMIQGVMLGKCVVSISAEIWTLCRAPITEMIMMDICNCLVDEWQHN